MKKFLLRIVLIYKPFKKAVITIFLFIACSQTLLLISPYIYGKIIDGIISHVEIEQMFMLAGLSFAVYVLHSVVIDYFRECFELNNFDFDVLRHLSKTTLEKILSFSVGQHNNQNSGVKQSVISKGQSSLSSLANLTVYELFPMVLQVVLTIAALFYLSFVLGAITSVGVICFLGITICLNNKLKGELKDLEDMWHENSKIHTEILRNVELVQINAQENKVIKEYDEDLGKVCSSAKKVWTKYMLFTCSRNLVTGITKFIVLVVGVYYVYQGDHTPGNLVIFLAWSSTVFRSLNRFGFIHRRSMQYYATVKKYFVMLDVEPDVKVLDHPIKIDALEGRIEFKDVSFKYPTRKYLEDDEVKPSLESDRKTLSNVSFVIEAGQKVAFVGKSGAGKSTVSHLLLRSYDPSDGQVIIDENDLRDLDLREYRESVGLVEQSVSLFDETLHYNLTFGLNGSAADVTRNELDEIARMSCVDKFYGRLENGFDTIIGERGIKLSGGERQRVGIARALIKKPKILIFDEATSNLDTENESLIQQSIEKVSFGRTTIIIAHRLSTIKNVDKIFVMDEGKIVGEGKHDELLQDCEVYKTLVSNQL